MSAQGLPRPPSGVPPHIDAWLERALPVIQGDDRLLGVAAGGSWLRDELDAWSDLDLVIAVAPEAHDEVMASRLALADTWGPRLSGFTGEHVGEPRLVIALYEDPVVHVDMKFVMPNELARRVEDPIVLWERDRAMSKAMTGTTPAWPAPEPQWIEDRIWTWVHYAACKIGRGELFESIAGLGFLRSQALVPLAMAAAGHLPQSARRVEQRLPDWGRSLEATLGAHDARACADALEASVELYRELRRDVTERPDAERAAMAFLAQVRAGLGGSS